MLDMLRRMGVAYLLVHPTLDAPAFSVNRDVNHQETRNLHLLEPLRGYLAGRQPVATGGGLRLYELDGADPMAFPGGEPARPLPIARVPSGARIDLTDMAQGGDVVVNYLWYAGIRASADGAPVATAADPFGRIRVSVPPDTQVLTVRYHSPWLKGMGIGLGLAALAACWFRLLRR